MNLVVIIRELQNKGFIDQAIRKDMNEIRQESRNPLQHNGMAFEFSSKQLKDLEDITVKAL